MSTPSSLPQHCPTPRELDDLELLAHDTLGLRGFEGSGGLVTLTVPRDVAAAAVESGGRLELVDPEGLPLARVDVESTYDAGDATGIAGPVITLSAPEFGAFRRLHLSPATVRERYDARTLTVPVTAPLTVDDLELIRSAAAGRSVLLLALTGTGTPEGLSSTALVRATLAAAALLRGAPSEARDARTGQGADVGVVAVPLASRGDQSADARLRELVLRGYAPRIPAGAAGSPATASRPAPEDAVLDVPGGGALPEPLAAIVQRDRPGPGERGLVLFFTGLSGSGKSTLARALHDRILEQGDRTVTSLDGDVVRRNLSAGLTFSKQDRETNIRRIGWVAAEISRHGGVALCSPIAPFDATRQQVRGMTEDAGGTFVLIHVATPLEECERRDRKGLYAKARRGEIPEFTGISSPYEEPTDATVRVDTTGRSIEDALADVVEALEAHGWLSLATSAG